MSKSKIEWTDETWNPVTGCNKVSPGCTHCYAEVHAKRFWGDRPFSDVQFHPERLEQPLRWRKPRKIFVNSMSDLFHEAITDEQLTQVFAVMALTPQHVYQVLTKRPERMQQYLRNAKQAIRRQAVLLGREKQVDHYRFECCDWEWPLPNVWMGVSVESQDYAYRVDILRKTPATVRFLSCEPLLGALGLNLKNIDWVIVGGESGYRHRPVQPEWIRGILRQTREAGVAFFFKQWGGKHSKARGRTLDGRTWEEMPSPRQSTLR